MSDKKALTRKETDHYLYEIAREYKKMARYQGDAELVLVGGGTIMLGYSFRDSTEDLDAIIKGSTSLIKEIANKVGDNNQLPNGWLNSDFIKTGSYSKELVLHSKFYKRFCNCLEVRIVPREYLIAMKLVSARNYKNDISDIVGILAENKQMDTEISFEQIDKAMKELYGGWEKTNDKAQDFIKRLIATEDLEEEYYKIYEKEKENKEKLLAIQNNDPNLIRNERAFSYLEDIMDEEKTSDEPELTL